MLGVVLVAGLAAGWMFLRDEGEASGSAAGSTPGPRNPARLQTADPGKKAEPRRSAEPGRTAEPVKLRPITGDQLCAVVPKNLRKSLVADGTYGGKDASTGAATETEKRAACRWTNNKMNVGNGVTGHRTLAISVEARSTESQNAVERAKDRFDSNKAAHERRVNVRDGKRIDGKTTGSAFGELKELQYGEASYSQSSLGVGSLKATVYVLQGPWLIEVSYAGSNRTGAKYPPGDEVRTAAGKVAALVTAEMAKDAAKVKLDGPCAILTVKDVQSAFFPTVSGPAVGGSDGRIQQTTCKWDIRERVEHQPGQEFTARGGELRVHVVDWGGGQLGAKFQFDRDAKKYDRYRAKGGIGDGSVHVDYEPRQELSGLGEKAFAVVSTTTRPKRPDEGGFQELLVKVLIGDRTVEFVFRGTTTGGGVLDDPGYQKPFLDADVAKPAVTGLAKTFLASLK